MGDSVSYRPCDACQIFTCVPGAADSSKGNGIDRSVEDHSSFDRPATSRLPLRYTMSVIVSMRGFSPAFGFDSGRSCRLTMECLALSRGTLLMFPEGSTRMIMAVALGPWPRATDRYTFFEM